MIADYQYDALNRLNLLTHYAPEDGTGDPNSYLDNEALAVYQYQLGLDGARQQIIEIDDQGRETVITYTYDGLNRLVKEDRDHYDDDLDATTVYILDPTGNRLEKRVDKGRDSTVDETTTYTYDQNDRLLTETFESIFSIEDRHTVYSHGPTEQISKHIYEGLDASGTLIEQHTFDYNVQGRQFRATIVKDGTTTVIETQYNDSGIRIKTTESVDSGTPKVTEYVIDSRNHTGYAQVLEEWVDGELVKTYTIGHTMLAQHDDTNGTLTFLADGHGSTRGLTNELGAVVERYTYDAFGNILTGIGLTTASAALTTHLYASEQFDHRTGLSYNRARYYDPSTGRFNRLDPWSGNTHDPQTLHKYLYAHASPSMRIDPYGTFALVVTLATMSAGYFASSHLTSNAGQAWRAGQNFEGFLASKGIYSASPLEISQKFIVPFLDDFVHHLFDWTFLGTTQRFNLVIPTPMPLAQITIGAGIEFDPIHGSGNTLGGLARMFVSGGLHVIGTVLPGMNPSLGSWTRPAAWSVIAKKWYTPGRGLRIPIRHGFQGTDLEKIFNGEIGITVTVIGNSNNAVGLRFMWNVQTGDMRWEAGILGQGIGIAVEGAINMQLPYQ